MHDRTYESKSLTFSNSDNGYADIVARIDCHTFRRIPVCNESFVESHVLLIYLCSGKRIFPFSLWILLTSQTLRFRSVQEG